MTPEELETLIRKAMHDFDGCGVIEAVRKLRDEAIAQEREECARTVELRSVFGGEPTTANEQLIIDHIAAAIRARKP